MSTEGKAESRCGYRVPILLVIKERKGAWLGLGLFNIVKNKNVSESQRIRDSGLLPNIG